MYKANTVILLQKMDIASNKEVQNLKRDMHSLRRWTDKLADGTAKFMSETSSAFKLVNVRLDNQMQVGAIFVKSVY